MPQTQKFHIVIFDEPDGTQIVQLFPAKPQFAEKINLSIDLFQHLLGKANILIAAFKMVFTVQIGVLVENDLIHIELVQVRIQQRKHNGFQFHMYFLSED